MLVQALPGKDNNEILFGDSPVEIKSPEILGIANSGYKDKKTEHIHSNGYVVDSLEAALWCFWKTRSFEQAVLTAANPSTGSGQALGEDTDTTAAICGQLAGAFYGERNIPRPWLEKLHMRKEITSLADGLAMRQLNF